MFKSRPSLKLTAQNALHQSIVAVVLTSLVPLLSLAYIGAMIWLQPEELSASVPIMVFISTLALSVAGFLILLKFPKNIIRLRQYVTDVAAGIFPDKISLLDTHSSDDLKYIENGLNIVLEEMRQQVETANEKQRIEHELRETVERQQESLLQAERHRAMIQSLGAACHHIGQPATILEMRLHLMESLASSDEEMVQIQECEKETLLIMDILNRLLTVAEFRTEPYIHSDEFGDTDILAI